MAGKDTLADGNIAGIDRLNHPRDGTLGLSAIVIRDDVFGGRRAVYTVGAKGRGYFKGVAANAAAVIVNASIACS